MFKKAAKKSVKRAKPEVTPEMAMAAMEETTTIDIEEMRSEILKQMGVRVFEPETRFTLKTRWSALNEAIGTPDGIPYGKMIEISGPESHGKSLIQKILYAEGQRDGATVIHGDAEDSDDPGWNTKLGIDNDSMVVIKPKFVYGKLDQGQIAKNADAREIWNKQPANWKVEHPFKPPFERPKVPQSAEQFFDECQRWVEKLSNAGVEKLILGIDSIANLTTASQLKAGMYQNMQTKTDISNFLSGALKQWQIMGANRNVLIILLNQIREKPGHMFGDPTYEPGGRALRHNCASRNRVSRKGSGRLMHGPKLVGINSILLNQKNKTGEGSVERNGVEMTVNWAGPKARIDFVKWVKKEKTEAAAE